MPTTLDVWKTFQKKVINIKIWLLYETVLFSKQKRNLSPFRTDVPLIFIVLQLLKQVLQEVDETSENIDTHDNIGIGIK